ncbi:anthranilate phosphoribosyltransferase [Natronogracilivirga saccharolytica]|uniref:Anthranilate phosphoribosyltransferase n=1 Tax=Natronogracilivirga saccharolytica TaxID=2812953 RepID=A0A8J7RII6_9BACT|nr:anthranilate phosphoribosyltransferase [Natronogracilivirga saccharolytica]MBP3192415.1 anthranilate phosphoribosyltransferase [Natronogracilivirga saccharolytica]
MQNFTDILLQISEGADLSSEQAGFALREIINGNVNEARMAAFLFGMRCKGETVEELAAMVDVMRDACVHVDVPVTNAVDLCGTGGDNSGTFNISTASMFVTAGAEVPVLKHGNSGVSSRSGSFDVLQKLGITPDLDKEKVETGFRQSGMAFMFAPLFHPAMGAIMKTRKDLAMRTFFNIMGPMLNPAGVKRQIVGAYSRQTAEKIARILENLGSDFAYTFHASDGLDECSTTTSTEIYQLKNGHIGQNTLDPGIFGMATATPEELKGGDPDHNARIIEAVLDGTGTEAQSDIVLLNATFAIHASGLYDDIQEAFYAAQESLESGAAQNALKRFAECTSDLKASA